ncbi:MAG: hypothetical protein JXA25_13025 [Anaerolineales bacterium]|nr:hypothetical protein [Anaerolineales bacterium]
MQKETQKTEISEKEAGEEKKIEFEEKLVETNHTIRINGEEIPYRAAAGTIPLKEDERKFKAAIFYTAYTRTDITDVSNRPLIFAFNGGPGSSSAWLHLGMLGPKRVILEQDSAILPPPYLMEDNPYSLLDRADMVFIDPVSTGYSRPAPDNEEPKEFHGIQKDIESVAEFIRIYTSRSQRWSSPKYLAGESYGTTRAAGLSGYLQERFGLYLNGIILISTILNFQSAKFDPGNDLPYVLFLPTYAASAWYHNCIDREKYPELMPFLKEVRQYAETEYLLALMQGSNLSKKDRTSVVKKLHSYTGLSEEYLYQTDLRIQIFRFTKQLLRSQGKTIGRLDSRYTGLDRDSAGEVPEFDPSYALILGAYTAAMNDYLRSELQFESDAVYEILTGLYENWDYSTYQNRYVNVAETLRSAMSQNPYLRVFVANGYFDLATPFAATDYTFTHLGLDSSLNSNITTCYYPAGHMIYIHTPSLSTLKTDLAAFLGGSS